VKADLNIIDFCSEKMLAGWKEDKLNTVSSEDMLDSYIKLYNDCMSGAPADMHFGVHLCRGMLTPLPPTTCIL